MRPYVVVLLSVAVVPLAACPESKSKRCGGEICASDEECDTIHQLCVDPEQLGVCVGRPDGELCTFGQVTSGYRCDQEVCLRVEECGNGQLEAGEECDLGASNSDSAADGCRTDCRRAYCGDGVTDSQEGCDAGAANSDTVPDACRTDCSAPTCGDGVVDSGESCDGSSVGTGDCQEFGYLPGAPTCESGCTYSDTGCPGSWGTASVIDTSNATQVSQPAVAVDADGNAMVLWAGGNFGQPADIRARRWIAGSGWAPETTVDTLATTAGNQALCGDGQGNYAAAWVQDDGTANSLYASRFVAGTGWITPQPIETSGEPVFQRAGLGCDANGGIVAVWIQPDNGFESVWVNRYAPGGSWGTAQTLEDRDDILFDPQVVVSPGGDAVVAFTMYTNGFDARIWAAHYAVGGSWTTAAPIENLIGDSAGPQLAIADNGDTVAVWITTNAPNPSALYAARYTAGTGWGTAQTIDAGAAVIGLADVSSDASGNAVALWLGTNGEVFANRYAVGTGWGTASVVQHDTVPNQAPLRIALNARGSGVALWGKGEVFIPGSPTDVWAARFGPRSGFTGEQSIEGFGGPSLTTGFSDVAVSPTGVITVVGTLLDGPTSQLWINRFE